VITPPEKMKQDLRRLIDNWQLEFDMDDYHIIGAVTVLLLEYWFWSDARDEEHEDDDPDDV
tara:strand:- start:22 stop:204 length:183 start_codon:yes stop_codon:yes gene_type:complete